MATNKEIGAAINYLVPSATFYIEDGQIIWEDTRAQPTNEDIDSTILLLPAMQKESAKRVQRNQLLSISDWTVLPHSPLSETDQAAWVSYRQELRDFTAQTGWVDLEFPTPPQ